METHLVDGLLGRVVSYIGLSIYIEPWIKQFFWHERGKRRAHAVLGLVLAWLAAFVLLNVLVQSTSDTSQDFTSIWRPELLLLFNWLHPVLLHTQSGFWWLVHSANLAVLTLLEFTVAKPRPVIKSAGILIWILSLARLGHAGAFHLDEPWLWFQLVHTTAVVLWMGALISMADVIFQSHTQFTGRQLKRFSLFMLFTMTIIVSTGVARSMIMFLKASIEPSGRPYLWLLLGKIGIVFILLNIASRIRSQIYSGHLNMIRLGNLLSFEIFLGAVLLFVSAFLSQLPPP